MTEFEMLRRARRRAPLRWILLLAAVACRGADATPASDEGWRGAVLAEPIPRPDFTLIDTDSEPFDFRARTEGLLTLVFFGYTSCPDICPVHMANLGAVLERQPYGTRARTRVIFITTDPDRDTPEVMRTWLDRFGPSFIGLRGPIEEVNRIQRALRLPESAAGDVRADGSYDVGHAASILAFSPEGPARVAYLFGTRQADWEHDLPRLLRGATP